MQAGVGTHSVFNAGHYIYHIVYWILDPTGLSAAARK